MEGFLWKKSRGNSIKSGWGITKNWNQRWVKIEDGRLKYYRVAKIEPPCVDNPATFVSMMLLSGCQVNIITTEPNRPFSFELHGIREIDDGDKESLVFSANSEEERTKWMEAICPPKKEEPKVTTKKKHERHSSEPQAKSTSTATPSTTTKEQTNEHKKDKTNEHKKEQTNEHKKEQINEHKKEQTKEKEEDSHKKHAKSEKSKVHKTTTEQNNSSHEEHNHNNHNNHNNHSHNNHHHNSHTQQKQTKTTSNSHNNNDENNTKAEFISPKLSTKDSKKTVHNETTNNINNNNNNVTKTRPNPTYRLSVSNWREIETAGGDESYFHNTETNQTTWNLTDVIDSAWVAYEDEATHKEYYYNPITTTTTWNLPKRINLQQARLVGRQNMKVRDLQEKDRMEQYEQKLNEYYAQQCKDKFDSWIVNKKSLRQKLNGLTEIIEIPQTLKERIFLSENASIADQKKACKRAMIVLHPDKLGDDMDPLEKALRKAIFEALNEDLNDINDLDNI